MNLNVKIKENKALIEYNELPSVMGERSQLIQLFQNVIENSLKFRREENPKVTILAHPSLEDGFFKFSVVDNGIGIETPYQQKVFQIFQRLNNREDYDGTGLGLAICKKIIEKHSGRIWIDQEYNAGLKLNFTLPSAVN